MQPKHPSGRESARAKPADPEVLAAIDLGSNSFRLEIARTAGKAPGGGAAQQLYTLDSLKEQVRLAAGLTKDKLLDRAAFDRGLATLERFGERLREFHPSQVRAVATNTLRVARNAPEFIREGAQRLGFPIEVIAGREEARLIYIGVAHTSVPSGGHRLVIDIGGGSTEFIVGAGDHPLVMESLYMGCVNYSMQYFPTGDIDHHLLKTAELAARRELQVITASLRHSGWQEAIGSSGTIKALVDVAQENGWSNEAPHCITRKGLRDMRAALIEAGHLDRLELKGLKDERRAVILGGFAILSGAFAELDLEVLSVAEGALRTGVLYDLLARGSAAPATRDSRNAAGNRGDMREHTVTEFAQRYQVALPHAERVASLALHLWDETLGAEEYEGSASRDVAATDLQAREALRRYLAWAGKLHEVGLSIAHNGYHKHSAYVLSNADMPGFSRIDQAVLAGLVLGHTGKLPKLADALKTDDEWLALACLRLAVLVHRNRSDPPIPEITLERAGRQITCKLDATWRRANPLSDFSLLQEEALWLQLGHKAPWRLRVVS